MLFLAIIAGKMECSMSLSLSVLSNLLCVGFCKEQSAQSIYIKNCARDDSDEAQCYIANPVVG